MLFNTVLSLRFKDLPICLNAGFCCKADEGFGDGYAVDVDLPADKPSTGTATVGSIQTSSV